MDEELEQIEVCSSLLKEIQQNESILPLHLSKLKNIKFPWHFTRALKPGEIPEGIEQITFAWTYNQIFIPGVFPESLQKLTFGSRYNQVLDPFVLPSSLRVIHFGENYNQYLNEDVLPFSLKVIRFGKNYNCAIREGILPPDLKQIYFGLEFNQEITENVLPNGLVKIAVDLRYRKKMILPLSCRTVIFEGDYERCGFGGGADSPAACLFHILFEFFWLGIQICRHRLYVRRLKETYPNINIFYVQRNL